MGATRLAAAQRQALYRDGYVLLPGIVPRARVDAALQAINHSLGSEGLSPDRLGEYASRSYCPELRQSAEVTDLLYGSDLWDLAQDVIGPGRIRPVDVGQIALRFPRPGPVQPPHPHIDGMSSALNGVPQGRIANFTALVGVFLSDLPAADVGNFTVWPGTHRLLEAYFQAHGPQMLLQGMPDVPLPDPVQITGAAGDAVLCHYQLAHSAGQNVSPHIRYACFFRLAHVEHEALHWTCMTDIWREWEGMRELTGAAPAMP